MKHKNNPEHPSNHSGWKRYIYTQEAFGLALMAPFFFISWYDAFFGDGPDPQSSTQRRLRFLEPIFGSNYEAVFVTIVMILIAISLWRKGRG